MELPIQRAIKATSSLSVRRQCREPRRCLLAQQLHTTPSKEATPVAHPTVPGPPPQAPQAAATHPQDRVARKRQIAETLRQNQQAKINPSKPTTILRKRFWKDVHVKETASGYEVHLDTRPVRTASRQVLCVPRNKKALAGAIAIEWDQLVSAQQAIKQHFIPLTSLTSRAVDIELSDAQFGPSANQIRERVVEMAMRYLGTDTLLCWAPEKNIHDPYEQQVAKSLRQRQREVAEPIIAYLTSHVFPGVEIVPILGEDSIVPRPQPEVTRQVISGWISGLPPYELAALERGVLATKSLLVAARLLVEWSSHFSELQRDTSDEGDTKIERNHRFDIEKAAEAANLEVLHQTERWGEVEDTHDVEKEDVRRQLGSVILLVG
ncbi:ATP synthase mitochondrial F1 complex assembly factor 2 [Vermiconidia calcicola]|uniref:ATP synthase mitochondrial F1 complex assembly factor 2 n=1 Tax=Vermiconidia calcicola TaxID=1690605 RepID=A0ACC3NHI3_9PEZI|nr:ATP synthase mitochondrial F1 complex assembly factor 2 [Vermiconidia calcicola]